MQADTPHALYKKPVSRFIATFMGEANILPATKNINKINCFGYEINLTKEQLSFPDDNCTIGVRPEAIFLSATGTEAQKCYIKKVSHIRPTYEVQTEWNGPFSLA